MAFDHNRDIISQQFSEMARMKYCLEIIICAFEYYTTSHSLYNRLRVDFLLPSLALLAKMTLKMSKLNEKSFLFSVFNNIDAHQKFCLIHDDDVYIKKTLQYHGRNFFFHLVDGLFLLCIILVCLNDGPKFLTNLIPISKLISAILFEQVELTILADVKAIWDYNHERCVIFKIISNSS